MNRFLVFSTFLLLSGTFSQTALADGPAAASALAPSQLSVSMAPGSSLTRAEVKALARAAERAGEIPRGQAAWPDVVDRNAPRLSRAEVKAQTRLALAAGEIPRGEAQTRQAAAGVSTVDRATVKAEARTAERLGLIPRGESNLHQY